VLFTWHASAMNGEATVPGVGVAPFATACGGDAAGIVLTGAACPCAGAFAAVVRPVRLGAGQRIRMACIAFINKLCANPSSRVRFFWSSGLSPTLRRLSISMHCTRSQQAKK